MIKKRKLYFYEDYFKKFYNNQSQKAKKKILWTLRLLEDLELVPEQYFKCITGKDGIYEVRIRESGNSFRVFCFFDGSRIVVGHGFQKKSQKLPGKELKRAKKIKTLYEEERRNETKKPG